MGQGQGRPSTGEQAAISVLLFVVDLIVIGWLVFRYGMTGWADSYDAGNPPDAPHEAVRATWLLFTAAVVTGGGFHLLRWRTCGTVQLLVLGAGATLLASLAARG
ncbi:DUF6234 family protein [Streptomyces sp. NPDC060184]|uniref:DUF6234 family protein n=1 Tax=Streptomyces sp. NPDC060184 TaxID=3347064 RepID=UPI003660DAB4